MSSHWKSHIEAWASENDRKPSKVEATLRRKGWNPNTYDESMRSDLYAFLDKWYTLSVKTLPEPATLRKNPIGFNKIVKEIKAPLKQFAYAVLSNGWRVDTFFDRSSQAFLTLAYNPRLKEELEPDYAASISESLFNHDLTVKELLA